MKDYIKLHAEINEENKLVLVDQHGRQLKGVRSLKIQTGFDQVSIANVELILCNDNSIGFSRGEVK